LFEWLKATLPEIIFLLPGQSKPSHLEHSFPPFPFSALLRWLSHILDPRSCPPGKWLTHQRKGERYRQFRFAVSAQGLAQDPSPLSSASLIVQVGGWNIAPPAFLPPVSSGSTAFQCAHLFQNHPGQQTPGLAQWNRRDRSVTCF
jgi:hypothetical protein